MRLRPFVFVTITAAAVVGAVAHTPGADPDDPPAAAVPARLVSLLDHARRTALVPDSDDGVLQQLRNDPRLTWYDKATTPDLFQQWKPADINGGVVGLGIVNTKTNISAAQPVEPFGNANREFPWLATGGVREDQPVFRFVVMPAPAKMRWAREQLPHVRPDDYLTWVYADGTVFGEVICVTNPATLQPVAVEVRLRRKVGAWTATAYRPFPTADDYAAAGGTLSALPRRTPVRLKNTHAVKVIDAPGLAEELPPLPADRVTALLARPFKNALGLAWRDGDPATHAPTTRTAYHVVPRDYDAAPIAVTTASCARCHDTVNAAAAVLQPVRDWYGRVRGADTIFSFHPFKPALAERYSTNDRAAVVDPKMVGPFFVWDK